MEIGNIKTKWKFYYNAGGICVVSGCRRGTEEGKLVCPQCFYGADELRFKLAREARIFFEKLKLDYQPLSRKRR